VTILQAYLLTGLAAMAALAALATVADGAERTAKRGEVEAARGAVKYSQLMGDPAVSFPLGCSGEGCHFSLHLEFIPAGEEALDTVAFSVEDNLDRCGVWIRTTMRCGRL
jgi:hypothetical protein